MKRVVIPKSLIAKLEPFGPRFIKVAKPTLGDRTTGKSPIEDEWQKHPYHAYDPPLQEWLENGGNYGVVCGENICLIDTDSEKVSCLISEEFDTFTVQSGSGKGKHFYVRSNAEENGTLLGPPDKNGKRENLGNIQAANKQVVGPNSVHYTGGVYKIIKDVRLAWVSKSDLERIFKDYLKWSGKSQKLAEESAVEEGKLIGFEIPLQEIVKGFDKFKALSIEEFQGSHPVHGSSTGQNFTVNIKKNCWHCFRCNSGGGPLSWLAVKNKLIRCDQAQKGVLVGNLFLKTVQLAHDAGYDVQLRKQEKVNGDARKYFEGEPPHFVPMFLADELMEEYIYLTRIDDQNIFIWQPIIGTYCRYGEEQIINETEKRLKKYLRRCRQLEVINVIRSRTIQKIKEASRYIIVLKNGAYNLKTGKLTKFDPNHFIVNALPVKYDPTAKTDIIEKFVSEIVYKEDIQVLQEIAGYCLWRDYNFHKAVMLVGAGANGKSTFLELLRAMLGNENVSTVSLQEITTSRFAISGLFGKLANIYPDLTDSMLKQTGKFKMLTGGDTIAGEYKYKDMFQFKNYAKLIFSANKLPESPDDTHAFFRRWIIIHFPNTFTADDPKTDKNLIRKLTTEKNLSGFLNWALIGLKRLLKNQKFSYEKSTEETRRDYIIASAPVKAFVLDRLEVDPKAFITKAKLYDAFLKYCRKKKLPSLLQNRFTLELRMYAEYIVPTKRKIEGKQARGWVGAKLVEGQEGHVFSQSKNIIDKNSSKDGIRLVENSVPPNPHDEKTWLDEGK